MDRLLKRYPQLSPAKVFDALAFAFDNPEVIEADLARERDALEHTRERKAGPRPPASEQIDLPFGRSPKP